MDGVIKVGGSLTANPSKLERLCAYIGEIQEQFALVVLPGGGDFADLVRTYDGTFDLPKEITHKMAILGIDQFGLFLSSFLKKSRPTSELEDLKQMTKHDLIPIFLPATLLFQEEPLTPSWNVTSDAIAAYVASLLPTNRVIIVTDVDGIYDKDPKKHAHAKLIKRITPQKLIERNRRTSVDTYLPHILMENDLDCYVCNGRYPGRIGSILRGDETICTHIGA